MEHDAQDARNDTIIVKMKKMGNLISEIPRGSFQQGI